MSAEPRPESLRLTILRDRRGRLIPHVDGKRLAGLMRTDASSDNTDGSVTLTFYAGLVNFGQMEAEDAGSGTPK